MFDWQLLSIAHSKWRSLPVIVRAVVIGSLLSSIGHIPTWLFLLNIKVWPSVPWTIPFVILYLWFFWQYVSGRWWPATTAETRRRDLRAPRLPPQISRWALLAGGLAVGALGALDALLSPITPPIYEAYYPLFRALPFVTLAPYLIVLSAVAGIVEEAAYRGYMQAPIERRHGPFVAITVMTFFFVLMHYSDVQRMVGTRVLGIAIASAILGLLARLSGSIVPGIIIHTVVDAFGLLLLWWLWSIGWTGHKPVGFAVAIHKPLYWLYIAGFVIFTAAAMAAFVKLARISTRYTASIPSS